MELSLVGPPGFFSGRSSELSMVSPELKAIRSWCDSLEIRCLTLSPALSPRERKGRTEPAGGKIKPVRSRLKIGLPTGLIGRGQVKPCTLSGQVPQVGIEIREDAGQGVYVLFDRRNAGSCAGVLAGVAGRRQALFGARHRGD